MTLVTGESFYGFGSFRLYPVVRELTCRGEIVELTSKRYDILLILIRCRHRIVTKEELMEAIWADVNVEPSNLDVNISGLRRTLKEADPDISPYIKTCTNRGFRFMVPVEENGIPVTVAILPFDSPEASEKVPVEIGFEMADTLTTKLNKNMSIFVTTSGTVNREHNEHPHLSALVMGQRLENDYVFSGRIWLKRRPDRVHVNLDLLNVRSALNVASSSFEEDYGQQSDLETSIHKWMESALGLTPTEEEIEQASKEYTGNAKAYELYKKGRRQRFKVGEAPLRRAIHYFRLATNEDPGFARAYANIADTYIFMGMLNLIPPAESYEGANSAALKARTSDPNLASAQTTWAFTKMFFEWNWDEAEQGFAKAIEINQNYAVAHMGYAHWLTAKGSFELAELEINRALARDPYSFFINFVRAIVLFLARKYAKSLEQFDRTHLLNRRMGFNSDLSYYGNSLALQFLAMSKSGEEREQLFKKADHEAQLAIRVSKRHPVKLMHRAQLAAVWGARDQALKIFDEVLELERAEHYVSQYHKAIVWAACGEVDAAIECLKKAHEARDEWFFLLGVDPRLDGLRSDSEFDALLRLIGLETVK